MQLVFDTIDELRDFVKTHLKTKRGGKDDEPDAGAGQPATGNAPQPLMPAQQHTGFNGPTGGFAPPNGSGPSFPSAAPGVDPAIATLVARVNARIDASVASGQNVDNMLNWFRGQSGPEAANATLDQIKQNFMHKLPMATLENIAKSMNA